jgi:uncharacterized protein (TIGR01655 family)
MKKIIASLIVFGIFLGGCFFSYRYYYGGTAYYTEITTSGTHSTSIASDSVVQDIYQYKQTAYNESGEKKVVEMNENRSKPLREGAYLKLLVNPRKGVISWEEVSQDDVPKPALEQLDNQ